MNNKQPNLNTSDKRHKYIESNVRYKYERVIFCEWCGRVIWHFNSTDNAQYQLYVDEPCIGQSSQQGSKEE